jgi:hypothetical protein
MTNRLLYLAANLTGGLVLVLLILDPTRPLAPKVDHEVRSGGLVPKPADEPLGFVGGPVVCPEPLLRAGVFSAFLKRQGGMNTSRFTTRAMRE